MNDEAKKEIERFWLIYAPKMPLDYRRDFLTDITTLIAVTQSSAIDDYHAKVKKLTGQLIRDAK